MTFEYELRLAKSFGRYHQQTKIGYGAVVVCFLISLSFVTVFKPNLSSRPLVAETYVMQKNKRMHNTAHPRLDLYKKDGDIGIHGNSYKSKYKKEMICNTTDPRSDLCEMDGDIRINGNSSNIFVSPFQIGNSAAKNESWKIRPYARKGDPKAMSAVHELLVKSVVAHQRGPNCTLNHSVPAIVFSIGGYTGNLFHDFTDVLVPLFITSRQFNGEVQFLITDLALWWVHKYKPILKHLSKYEIIDFNMDNQIHCFQGAIVGLRCHKELSIDPSRSPNGYSMYDFGAFLRTTYSLERTSAIKIHDQTVDKPRLLIISRKRSRTFTNENEIIETAQSLGYAVVIAEPTLAMNMSNFARIVNSCDVMMGVHGAGLTNLVFLPTNAVLIQVVPWGGLEWFSRSDFGEPAIDMKLRYIEYKIGEKESTLTEQYPRDHEVIRDPLTVHKRGWLALKSVYLDKQNVTLDVVRFRTTLLEALELLRY